MIPDTVISKWPEHARHELAEFVAREIGCKPSDVYAAGSRVFGGFRPNSDIDIAVRGEGVFFMKLIFKGTKVSVMVRAEPKSPYGKWNLPVINLITGQQTEGNQKHIQIFKARQKNHMSFEIEVW